MSSTTFALECPVCLDNLRNPVVPPCGHLICEPCIRVHISLSMDRFEARCPTCRAPFPNVLANLSLIPAKYHIFINPPLRRVYLGDRVDNSKVVIDDLKSKIVRLEARIEILKSDNVCVKRESCIALDKAKDEAQRAIDEAKKEARLVLDKANADAQLALDEGKEEARLAFDKVNKEAQLAMVKARGDLRLAYMILEECKDENNALKSRIKKSRLIRNTSGSSLLNTPLKHYFGLVSLNDLRLMSAAREALAILSSSPTVTQPFVAPAPSGSLAQTGTGTLSVGSSTQRLATDQAAAATTGGSGATSNTPIWVRFSTPPHLYPRSSPVVSHTDTL